jgi:putative ATP-dependent endonuclease of OLD family
MELPKENGPATTKPAAAPAIYHLAIDRFRGIKSLRWAPAPGVNVILGGGDVGKTTILDAIGLLLSPTNATVVSDTDYYLRRDEDEFVIEAIIALPPGSGISQLTRPAWPWNWDGTQALVPDHSDDGAPAGEPVYRLRVRGTSDLELTYEIVQPNGSPDSLPVALRRAIGLVRLSGDDRNDRDLRLVQGSALDRLLSDKGLRSRMASELAKSDVRSELGEEARIALGALDTVFKLEKLPGDLDIAITGGQGASVASLVGLTAKRETVQLPLASWGAGTRRLSALTIAEQIQGEAPVTLVDEVERGLEPYRQRLLMAKLQAGSSQVFITTHSPAAVSAASLARLWYVDHAGAIGPLDGKKVDALRADDPEAFLARLTIVAEGATEVGFVSVLLERALGTSLQAHGIHIADGDGHESTIGILEALADGGLSFGGFADDEQKHPDRWAALHRRLGTLLFRWKSGDIESNIIGAVAEHQLERLLSDPAGEKTGYRLRTLADRLGISEKEFAQLQARAGEGFRALMIEAAHGNVPVGKDALKKEYKNHAKTWFKSVAGGREIADKVFTLGLWPELKADLLPFCNAVRTAAQLEPLDDLAP